MWVWSGIKAYYCSCTCIIIAYTCTLLYHGVVNRGLIIHVYVMGDVHVYVVQVSVPHLMEAIGTHYISDISAREQTQYIEITVHIF